MFLNFHKKKYVRKDILINLFSLFFHLERAHISNCNQKGAKRWKKKIGKIEIAAYGIRFDHIRSSIKTMNYLAA